MDKKMAGIKISFPIPQIDKILSIWPKGEALLTINEEKVFKKLLVHAKKVANDRTTNEYIVLHLSTQEYLTVADMARMLCTNRQTIQYVAHKLVNFGLCRYQFNPHKKRSPYLVINDVGRNYLSDNRQKFVTLSIDNIYSTMISLESLY
jgi:DNA-binding MarR family transcriptional regulator